MVAITATSSATPLLQAAVLRSKMEQAQREADRADAEAKSLQTQADDAERQANEERGLVRDLASQSRQLQSATYSRNAATPEVPMKTQDFLVRLYGATSGKFAAGGNALKANANAAPVVNAQGQATGRILNLSA